MFKEAEEKRLTSGELSRMRRRRRLPQRFWMFLRLVIHAVFNSQVPISNRFPGEVQGKELEAILKDEGVIEPDEEIEENLAEEEDAEIEAIDLQLNRENQDEIQRESDEENAISTIAVRDTF